MNSNLPDDQYLDVSSFSSIFDRTTNSYKYLFFLALIRKVNEVGKSELANTEIKLIDIAVELLLIAWFPHRYFRLSFGVQDQCAKILHQFINSQNRVFENGPITNATVGLLRMELTEWLEKNTGVLKKLLKYVPFRLLSPFYENELRGVQDAQKNIKIVKLANESNIEKPSLYTFSDDSVTIDGCWREYIQRNFPIIESWAKWHWCQYLQSRNPAVPSIPNKILPILHRVSLTKEINYWKDILKYKELRCIYTNSDLSTFELDHFLPWTFVTHNQPWNLIPVNASANSSKSNNLPSLSYLDSFIEGQASAIKVAKKIYSERKWKNFMEPYLSDLKISSYEDLLDESILDKAFRSTMLPLYEIASTNGFSGEWKYQKEEIIVSDGFLTGPCFVEEVNEEDKYDSLLPFYPIQIAAGGFAESGVTEEPEHWVDVSRTDYFGSMAKDLFISQVHGQSMEPLIPDGSYCLFRYGVTGSRNNRVLLVKKDGIIDPDMETSFTIKRYFSEKKSDSEFGWVHQKIELKPENQNYDVITVNMDDAENIFVVAEFVQVIYLDYE